MRAVHVTLTVLVLVILVMANVHFQVALANTDMVVLQDKALSFVKNVLPFNMRHYNIGVSESYYLSDPNDTTVTQVVVVDLNSTDSMIQVVCVFDNGSLYQCAATPTGMSVSDKPYSSIEDVANRILKAYQEETGLDSTFLLKCLSLVNNTEPANVTIGEVGNSAVSGVSLSVTRFPDLVGSKTVNGMPVPIPSNSSYSTTFNWLFSNASVSLMFDKGLFADLQDDRAPLYETSGMGLLSSQASETETTQLKSSSSSLVPVFLALTILVLVVAALLLVFFLHLKKTN